MISVVRSRGAWTRSGWRPRQWPFWSALAVLVVGFATTAVLAWLAQTLYENNERRLLKLRAHEAAAVVAQSLPVIQTPLASAAALADATSGDAAKFDQFITPYLAGRPFVSVSLWQAHDPAAGPVAVAGLAPALSTANPTATQLLARAASSATLVVMGPLAGQPPRLGFAYSGPSTAGAYVAYGETALPRPRYGAKPAGGSFSDLDYAIYVGRAPRRPNLLLASVGHLPLPGRHIVVTVPFGDSALTLVVSPRRALGGTLPQRLPRAIVALGILLTLGASALTLRLIDRRRHAEALAERLEEVAQENRRLYTQQRSIAQTLQQALLPSNLPTIAGIEAAARYEPGVEGVEVGGDWYDLIVIGDDRLLLVVGDVSGRGLPAATTMASLRYAVRAYAAQADPPAAILAKLGRLLSVEEGGQLATVLCALLKIGGRTAAIASAGHLPPLLLSDRGSELVAVEVGVPIGVDPNAAYTTSTISVPPRATLLAFTDGLVERRGESIDAGLERLRQAAQAEIPKLDDLLTHILDDLRGAGRDDDTAIAAVRWIGQARPVAKRRSRANARSRATNAS